MIYFTSDLHFHHKNVIRYCNRPFKDVDDMNSQLCTNWNNVVNKADTVYIIGDVFFCDVDKAVNIISNLNGYKKLILGNHDKIIKNQKVLHKYFDILPPLHETKFKISDQLYSITMCHYPMYSWNCSHYGSFMLHGHIHSKTPINFEGRRIYDVGVDANNYAPVSLDSIISTLSSIPLPQITNNAT